MGVIIGTVTFALIGWLLSTDLSLLADLASVQDHIDVMQETIVRLRGEVDELRQATREHQAEANQAAMAEQGLKNDIGNQQSENARLENSLTAISIDLKELQGEVNKNRDLIANHTDWIMSQVHANIAIRKAREGEHGDSDPPKDRIHRSGSE